MGKDKKSKKAPKDGLTKKQNKVVEEALAKGKKKAAEQRLNLEVANLDLSLGNDNGKVASSPTPEATVEAPTTKPSGKGGKKVETKPYMSGSKKAKKKLDTEEALEHLNLTGDEGPLNEAVGYTEPEAPAELTKAERKALKKAQKAEVAPQKDVATENPFEAALDRVEVAEQPARRTRTPKFAKEFGEMHAKANEKRKPQSWTLPDAYAKDNYGESNIIPKFREEPFDYNISATSSFVDELGKFQVTITIDPDEV